MKVTKRDGTVVSFDPRKISSAIRKSFLQTKESSSLEEDVNKLTQIIIDQLNKLRTNLSVEKIQDYVEIALMSNKFYNTAKSYILYRDRRTQMRLQVASESLSKLVQASSKYFDYDSMREFVYFRTYSRWIEKKNRREVWSESVRRYMRMMKFSLKDKLTSDEYTEIEDAILKQEIMPSMRLLQFAGKAAKRCNVCVYNCAFTAPECIKDLVDIMYISMCGTGIGFSVEPIHVNKFPVVKSHSEPLVVHNYVIEDSKEGWCDAFEFGLNKWYAGEDVIFDYTKLRPAGARLKIMGGRSSGPRPLMDLMKFTKETIFRKQGHKLSTVNLYDIICKIGQIVVSGGVRRSAMISLSGLNDLEIRDAKNGAFWTNNPQRSMANNSAVYTEKPSMIEFMNEWLSLAESGTGERGIFNRGGLAKVLPQRRLDVLVNNTDGMGINPCAEIILKPMQFCNLSEVVCRPDDTIDTLMRKARLATIIGTYQASLTDYKYISPKWKENQEKERLLGVSLTGQWDCDVVREADTLRKLKQHCIDVNKEYAERFGINQSTAITAIKPSGTVSQLTNSASGIHPRFSKYYIRRIRISSTDPLLRLMKDQGYPCYPEVGQNEFDANTFVLEFPVKSPDNSICVNDMTAIEQLEYWKSVKINYTEHNPSVTIYVKSDEWLSVAQWVWDNWDYVTGLSFLPYSEHIYELSPYEAITQEEYEKFRQNLTPVDFSKLIYYELTDSTDVKREVACAGGACEL